MKPEAYLFAGVAAFFLVTDAVYIWLAREPAGAAALAVSFAMSSVIAFFCAVNHRRKGGRPEDRPDGEIAERAGRLDFFPPHSTHPAVTAVGMTLMSLGVVFGLWLFLIGLGVTGGGIFGMVFQYTDVEA
ncbi:cytochrome c oxidase subunit 4 [Streptomyces sp. AV19]|uniref:aa3-type cytochrome oxidase subunit IV n=1 Tax=Streptomyces sp. AV19 TaxID=2793068 RepID=UPI0018FE1A55|nr:cytochrome c oxidase subunit 4 [Streptomyces sp. AV19]MBH1937730.1 cytochrome c oxidase subunit 4 [Streptomyces sp. AV19]MDG4536398.1 cytochrome c oxidase subunit 4 [Streptomyces sp. AV19]